MKKMILRFLLVLSIVLFFPFAGIGRDSITKHQDSLNTLLELVTDELKPRIYLQLSELLLPADTTKAIAYAYSALKIAKAHQLEPAQIESLIQLSNIFFYQGLVQKSLEHTQQALHILHTYAKENPSAPNQHILEGKCFFNKARAYRVLFADSVNIILDDLRKAKGKLQNTKDYQSLAGVYQLLGQQYLEMDMIDAGLENSEKALVVYRLLGNKRAMATIYGGMSHEVDRVNSIKYTQRAIELYAEADDSLGMARLLVHLAYQTRNILDTETNMGYLDLAWQIYKKHDAYNGMVYCLFHRYGYYMDVLHQPDSGLKYLLQATEIIKEHQVRKDAGHIFITLGNHYRYKQKYPLADYYFNQADSVTLFNHEKASRIRYLAELGNYYMDLKRYDEAEKLMLESLRLARNKKEPQMVNIAYSKLIKLYKAKGDFENALLYYQKKKEMQDSILNKHTERVVAEMQIKFETEKKEHALEIMKKNEQMKNLQLKRRRNTIYAISLGLAVVLGFLILLAWQYQKKRAAYAQLMKKNLELIKKDTRPKKSGKTTKLNHHLDPEVHRQIIQKLNYQIKQKKVFLQANLSLNSLAKKCHTNSSYLSHAINCEYQSNFSGFINALRIREAQKMMADANYASYSVEGISASVGFKTKSVFNAAFKKYTGVTPSYYLEYLIENQ